MSDWTTDRVREVLLKHLDPIKELVMTEFQIDGGQCDVVKISRSGYATEYEIKVSRADWRADVAKDKWRDARPHIRRFFYVVPSELIDERLGAFDVPSWVQPTQGIIVAYRTRAGFDAVKCVRAAIRLKAQKVPAEDERRALLAAYYRYWRHAAEMSSSRDQLREQRVRCRKCYSRMHCSSCEGYVKVAA
jgi:hypothetical protein